MNLKTLFAGFCLALTTLTSIAAKETTIIQGTVVKTNDTFCVLIQSAPGAFQKIPLAGETNLLEKAERDSEQIRVQNEKEGLLGIFNALTLTVIFSPNGCELVKFSP